jgi:hypothetical protein
MAWIINKTLIRTRTFIQLSSLFYLIT